MQEPGFLFCRLYLFALRILGVGSVSINLDGFGGFKVHSLRQGC